MSQMMLTNRLFVCRNAVVVGGLPRLVSRSFRTSIPAAASSSSSEDVTSEFFAKNRKRGSPMSPYVGYKPQITTVLSITHRMSGLGLGVLLYGIGIAELTNPGMNYAEILQSMTASAPGLFALVKFAAGTSIAFHTFNGVRHLVWDTGRGYGLKQLYASGYAVVALTIIATAYMFVGSQF